MATRGVLIASGSVAILVGLFYLFGTVAAVRSFELGEPVLLARHFARATGAAVLAIGVINILSVGDPGSRALRAVFVGNIVVHVLSIYTDLAESFARNTVLWITFGLHIVIIAAFVYLLVTCNRQQVRSRIE
jgi:hypothetical protein